MEGLWGSERLSKSRRAVVPAVQPRGTRRSVAGKCAFFFAQDVFRILLVTALDVLRDGCPHSHAKQASAPVLTAQISPWLK